MQSVLENFPFLTYVTYLDVDYLGIVGNHDSQITSIYVYNQLPTEELKKQFLQYGDEWWWETNRQVPINIALKAKWQIFRPYMKTFITKDLTIHSGPLVSIEELSSKRIKRRQIQLVRRPDVD